MKETIKRIIKWPWSSRSNEEGSNWRSPTTALEVVSKSDLDAMQDEVINDLQAEGVLNPKALFYIYKYIDAKFDKEDFDVEDRFTAKANQLDQFYSEGKSEVYAAYTDYETLVARTREADARLRRAIMALDPETDIATSISTVQDDCLELKSRYDQLPNQLKWENQ